MVRFTTNKVAKFICGGSSIYGIRLNNFDGIVPDIYYFSKISVSKEDLNFESLSSNVVSYGLVA